MFPLKKENILLNSTETEFLDKYQKATEIPILPHPGAFGKKRKNHQHEGIDLYCEKGDEVLAIEDGVVIKIKKFTGEHVGSNWWNNSWCVLVEGVTGVFNYGEIIPNKEIKVISKANASVSVRLLEIICIFDLSVGALKFLLEF